MKVLINVLYVLRFYNPPLFKTKQTFIIGHTEDKPDERTRSAYINTDWILSKSLFQLCVWGEGGSLFFSLYEIPKMVFF